MWAFDMFFLHIDGRTIALPEWYAGVDARKGFGDGSVVLQLTRPIILDRAPLPDALNRIECSVLVLCRWGSTRSHFEHGS